MTLFLACNIIIEYKKTALYNQYDNFWPTFCSNYCAPMVFPSFIFMAGNPLGWSDLLCRREAIIEKTNFLYSKNFLIYLD